MNLTNSRFDNEIIDGALFCTRPYEFDIWKTFSAPYVELILNFMLNHNKFYFEFCLILQKLDIKSNQPCIINEIEHSNIEEIRKHFDSL